jgi:hypothetical protein
VSQPFFWQEDSSPNKAQVGRLWQVSSAKRCPPGDSGSLNWLGHVLVVFYCRQSIRPWAQCLPVLVSKALGFDHPESSEGAGKQGYNCSLCIRPVMPSWLNVTSDDCDSGNGDIAVISAQNSRRVRDASTTRADELN